MFIDQRVKQSGLAVRQQGVGHLQGYSVGLIFRRCLIDQRLDAKERYRQLDLVFLARRDVGHRTVAALWGRSRLHTSESLFQQGRQRGVGCDVAAENQAHVRRHIVFLEERRHIRQARILQVLRRTDDGIGIRLLLEHRAEDFLLHIAEAVGRTVLLFVDVLQLALEASEHGLHQALGVQPAPLLHKLRQEGVVVVGHVVTGAGVEPAAAIFRDETAVLVGNGVVGSLQTQLVDMLLDTLALSLDLGLREQVVLRRDAVEPRLFLLVVDGAYTVGALEHDMLEIMGDARVRAVLGPRLHDDGTEDLRLRVVLVEPDGHAVTEFQFLNLQLCADSRGRQRSKKK